MNNANPTSPLASGASTSPGSIPVASPGRSAVTSETVYPSSGDYHIVAALFNDRQQAENAIHDLKGSALYDASEIGVAMRDREEQRELAAETGTHATEGAVSGVVGGGILGGIAGWLIAVGAITIPGVGPVLAGGALASALGVTAGTAAAGAGIGAAAGGVTGALIGLGIPEKDADFYEKGFREGGVIVTVRARNIVRAIEILRSHGGQISDASGRYTTLSGSATAPATSTSSSSGPSAVRYP